MTETPELPAIEFHPVQNSSSHGGRSGRGKINSMVPTLAYEVYCHLWSAQPALLDLKGRGCRGGFSTGELICLLYARNFPKAEWRKRLDEAMKGSENL